MVTEKQVEKTFARHFAETHNYADAYNRTLDELADPYPGPFPHAEAVMERRRHVGGLIRKIHERVMRKAGDPAAVVLHETIQDLRRTKAIAKAKAAYRESASELRREAKRMRISYEEALDRYGENFPYLYILFTRDGQYEGWKIDYPQYFQGHSGIVVSVPAGSSLDDARAEIGNVLAEALE